jgi:hypothetical protein
VTIVGCSFTSNRVAGGLAGISANIPAGNGYGIGPDFFNRAGRVLPTLTATTLGGGTVMADPPNPPYLSNSLATVTATAAPGWQWLSWLGDAVVTNETLTMSVTRNKYLLAVFGTPLTGAGLIARDPQVDFYPYGTAVKLTALPPAGTYFVSWSGDASGTNNPLSFVVTNPNPVVSCLFGALSPGQVALTVIEDGRGAVAVDPPASRYGSGQVVTLTATPDAVQDFLGWGGDASGRENPLVVTMDRSRVVTATFTRRPTLSVQGPLAGLTPEGLRLVLQGEFGTAYQILGSTNLSDWLPLAVVTNQFGTVQFTDDSVSGSGQRFYRAVPLP